MRLRRVVAQRTRECALWVFDPAMLIKAQRPNQMQMRGGGMGNPDRRAFKARLPQPAFARAAAVSSIRFEKPHSLSYQDSTRTMRWSSTLV